MSSLAQAATQGPAVTIMIPVYNGAQFLRETLDSALAQTFTDFEVICADDASTDESVKIVEGYAARDPRIHSLPLPKNLGSAARVLNEVLKIARGRYLVYSSQDDLFSADWLENMHSRISETEADAVIPELEFFFSGSEKNRSIIGIRGDRSRVITGREAVELSLDWTIPGNALWNADILKQLTYADIGAWSDEFAVRRFFMECRKVAFSGGRFFYRQNNPNAITKKFSLKTLDSPRSDIETARLLNSNGFPANVCARSVFSAMRSLLQASKKLTQSSNGLSASEILAAKATINSYLSEFRKEEFLPCYQSVDKRRSFRDWITKLSCTNGERIFYIAAPWTYSLLSSGAELKSKLRRR